LSSTILHLVHVSVNLIPHSLSTHGHIGKHERCVRTRDVMFIG